MQYRILGYVICVFLLSMASCSQENPAQETSCGVTNVTQSCYCSLDLMGVQTCTESGMWSVCECVTGADSRDINLGPDMGQQDIAADAPYHDTLTQEMGEVLETDLALNDSVTQEIGEVLQADITPDETPDAESDVSVDIPVVSDVSEMSDAGEVVEDVGPEEDVQPEPVFDCAAVAPGAPVIVVHDTLKGYHGLAFDTVGNYYGAVADVIFSATYGEPATPFGGTVAWMEQLERLPDGDLVACGESAVYRISTETGGNEPLSTAGGCYGVRVGPDGMVYTGDGSRVYRIDPETGVRTTFVMLDGARVMDFSPDASRMYIGTNTDGAVWYVDLEEGSDGAMRAISSPIRFYSNIGLGGTWMDGLAVDICGNVYVAEYYNGAMYRITPDAAEKKTLWSYGAGGSLYGHGIMWGSGVGGWDDHTFFIPMPYNDNKVGEVYIGIPYRTWEGTVLNRIPML